MAENEEKTPNAADMTVKQLKSALRELNLSANGNKATLLARLKAAPRKLQFEDDEKGDSGESSGSEDDDENFHDAISRYEELMKTIKKKQAEKEAKKKKKEEKASPAVVHCSQHFSYKDIEESVSKFNGDDHYKVSLWITEFEQNAELFSWNQLQKLVYAKRLLEGSAKRLLKSISVKSWSDLKEALKDEFDKQLSGADAHLVMQKTKKKKEEGFHEYFIRMRELGAAHSIDNKSIFQYVIAGIDDSEVSKSMLYGAKTAAEFKERLYAYESFANARNAKSAATGNKTGSKDDKKKEVRCYACGTIGHIATKCPSKKDGVKCFKCNAFGHIASACTMKKTDEKIEKKEKDGCLVSTQAKHKQNEMFKDVYINNVCVSALFDTGSDKNLLRRGLSDRMGIEFHLGHTLKLKTAGNKELDTIGYTEQQVQIDDDAFASVFHVVSDDDLPVDIIIGKELLQHAEMTIRNNQIISLKPIEASDDDEANFLLHIRVDDEKIGMPDDLTDDIRQLIEQYKPAKSTRSDIELNISMLDEVPVFQQPRRLPFAQRDIVEEQVQKWINDGVAIPFSSEYASPVVVVRKKDGSSRVCIDYRNLNQKMIKDRYPVPNMDDILDKLQKVKIFSTIDLKNGFFHVPVNENSRKYLSFVTQSGQYTFLKTPFGCCNSPRVFQRYINDVFRDLIQKKIMMVYMDDAVILAENEEEAKQNLKLVLKYAANAGLEINWKKCQFLQKRIEFLGHVIEDGKIKPSADKIEAVKRFPQPKNEKDVQKFLGLTGYLRKFIQSYAVIAKPLSDLLRKTNEFHFGAAQVTSFDELKKKLCEAPVLRIYQQDAETQVHTDASKWGFGGMLMQKSNDDQRFHPVFYMSEKSTPAEEKYDSYTLEALGAVKAVSKFRIYLLDKKFTLVTDCEAFKKTMAKKDVVPRVARWVMYLQDFDFTTEHRPGDRMKHVDALSRYAVLMISVAENLQIKIKRAQLEDDTLKPIFDVLKEKHYDDYLVRNEILYKYVQGLELLVVPQAMEEEVIKSTHENGHFGVKKVEEAIQREFFIPKMKEKVKKCIQNCVRCILAERKHGKHEGFLHPIDKGDVPLHTYHIDHIGPMMATTKMYKHLLVVVDAFSKFTWLYPTKTTSTSEVLDKLRLQATNFGNPMRIIADKAKGFDSNEFNDYCKDEGIVHVRTTTGMPRANGQVERINRCIIPVLTKASMDDPTKWYKYVSALQQALNSTYQRSIATTPFQLLFGVPMRRKEDIRLSEFLEDDFRNQFIDDREEEREQAKAQIYRVQEENRNNFNKKRKPANSYKVGDLVAVKRTQFVNGNKFATKFLGPYRIVKANNNERYDVMKEGSQEGPKKTSTSAEYMKLWSFEGK